MICKMIRKISRFPSFQNHCFTANSGHHDKQLKVHPVWPNPAKSGVPFQIFSKNRALRIVHCIQNRRIIAPFFNQKTSHIDFCPIFNQNFRYRKGQIRSFLFKRDKPDSCLKVLSNAKKRQKTPENGVFPGF